MGKTMTYPSEKQVRSLLARLYAFIKTELPPKRAELLVAFAKQYFATVSSEDLAERSIKDLYGTLRSHFELLYQREHGDAKVRVFNPSCAEHGWQSTHTVIELIHDDMPFLVDSVRMEINRRGFLIHFIIHTGGLKIRRSANGRVMEVLTRDYHGKDVLTEASIYLEIDRQTDPAVLQALQTVLTDILQDVTVAVEDWHTMLEHLDQSLMELEQTPPPQDPAEITESKAFLRWLKENFIFFGCRDYCLVDKKGEKSFESIPGLGVGVLRETTENHTRHLSEMPPEARKLALSPQILIIAKTNTRATIHRSAYTDYVGVKRFDKAGNIIGERRFIGLYTSSAYNSNPKHIPFLRLKVAKVLQQSGLSPHGHAGKNLLNILETLPRDDLFQASPSELLLLSMGIFHLQDRQRTRFFMRKDSYGRFYSCLVYLPKDSFNTVLVRQMRDILLDSLQGEEVSFVTQFSESVLARIHFMVRVKPDVLLSVSAKDIEEQLVEVSRSWMGDFHHVLVEYFGEAKGVVFFNKYRQAFLASYKEAYTPWIAAHDIEHFEKLRDDLPLGMHLYQLPHHAENEFRFKVYQRNQTIPLSDALPILENMGLRVMGELPHEVRLPDGSSVWVNDFDMVLSQAKKLDIEKIKNNFQRAFAAVWLGNTENDAFNRLVTTADLNWRQVMILRAYSRYAQQLGAAFSLDYMARTIGYNTVIARMLIDFFEIKFKPDECARAKGCDRCIKRIEKALEAVLNLDEDRILRSYLVLMRATLRTNYFQQCDDDRYRTYLSFKVNVQQIPDAPSPRPMFEIYVYSPRFEGVHLRGGKVARGGLRWSDRQEDFRTEILGLMKAQQVKNAVIVPVGAKGGFVARQLLPDATREETHEEGVACYKLFVQALLDISDNVVNKKIVHPKGVVRYDEDDSYLVVAADKGTATFSDMANALSEQHGFWLGDAFASGGSTGYDHKKMGITARGAWESVKRHFRELDRNIQKTEFTAVGIGDMAGDVFGNGVLLSKQMKLVAAFNHRHIFIDPNPDPAVSFKERKRLFSLLRSTWADYDATLISKGGGVFKRSDKCITLSDEIRGLLGTRKEHIIPAELITLILQAPVDLLWNGGIGTFAKASTESHLDVGDRINDSLRVDAKNLQCKVVGEGGNLGFSQKARVEFALGGGKIYTDFVDNSAGVNCSDHEVNIKILLNQVVAEGDLSKKQRNQLLSSMTKEVGELVLRDNYRQTLALSYAVWRAKDHFDQYARYLTEMVSKKVINVALESLPDKKETLRRKVDGLGFSAPELAVLFAYCKIDLKNDILKTKLPEDPAVAYMLTCEFPQPLREQFGQQMQVHMLRREIIAMQISNMIVNEMGIAFVSRLREETGASVSQVIRAFMIAQNIFEKTKFLNAIKSLDLKVAPDVQFKLMKSINRLIRRGTRWLLRNRRGVMNVAALIEHFTQPVCALSSTLSHVVSKEDSEQLAKRTAELMALGVPEQVAQGFASCFHLFSALDVIEAATVSKFSLEKVAKVYFELGAKLEINWFRYQLLEYKCANHWESLARSFFRDEIDTYQRMLAISLLKKAPKEKLNEGQLVDLWIEANQRIVGRWLKRVGNMRSAPTLESVMFSVALRDLQDLTHANRRLVVSE
jgi:glutamate dehydrogenase